MRKSLQHRRPERGFSLIELMIVIAIIGILVSVGIVSWRTALRKANEAAAIETLGRIRDAQASYALSHRSEFGTFDQLIKDGGMDEKFKGDQPVVSGYVYTMKVTPKSTTQPANYTVNADPQVSEGTINATGHRHFYVDPNVPSVRENPDQQASANDPSIGG
ncbi:MAG TPA: prepilin-type N-terminal cleavage/methylation domain-containing protein [Pyrinomonadaceae bacterium]|jgi:prepilin-type N-terminal cleavage/methylation domain-containing protein